MFSIMKYAALMASLAAMISCQTASQFPDCSIPCYTSTLENDVCSPATNFTCQCGLPGLYQKLSTCVEAACDQADAADFLNGYISTCKSVEGETPPGAPATVLASGSGSSSSAASSPAGSSSSASSPATSSTVARSSSSSAETTVEAETSTPTSSPISTSSSNSAVATTASSSTHLTYSVSSAATTTSLSSVSSTEAAISSGTTVISSSSWVATTYPASESSIAVSTVCSCVVSSLIIPTSATNTASPAVSTSAIAQTTEVPSMANSGQCNNWVPKWSSYAPGRAHWDQWEHSSATDGQ